MRESTAQLIRWAKPRMVPVIIIGHVTKEGNIAGPRVLEHMVDAVLYLEGERFQQFRILRAVKNRFGSTDEVGVFEMAESGLQEVRNPSEAFLQERALNAAGSTVTVTLEGSRPILVEVQALTSPSVYGLPRRSANGFDQGRLQLLVAVLQKRAGLNLADQDVYTNAVGGLRISEPGADLAVATAIASSLKDRLIDPRTVVIGEIGLSGEVRSVSQLDRRLLEASRLGFTRAIVPASIGRRTKSMPGELDRAASPPWPKPSPKRSASPCIALSDVRPLHSQLQARRVATTRNLKRIRDADNAVSGFAVERERHELIGQTSGRVRGPALAAFAPIAARRTGLDEEIQNHLAQTLRRGRGLVDDNCAVHPTTAPRHFGAVRDRPPPGRG